MGRYQSTNTITVPAGTYQVSLGGTPQLTVNANVTIAGAGESSTIVDGTAVATTLLSGCGSGCTAQPKTVSLSGLTVRNSGGVGVSNPGGAGPMTLDHVTLSGNATGLDNRATMTLTNVTVRDNGNYTQSAPGGILDFGGSATLTATSLTVTGNRSGSSAGGIRADNGGFPPGGTLTINGGTIGNNASNGGPAGGLSSAQGVVTLTNVTVSGNTNVGAGPAQFGRAGGINATGPLTLTNVALTGNQLGGTPGVGTVGGLLYGGGSAGLTMTGGSVTGNGGPGVFVGGVDYGGQAGTISGTLIENNRGNAQDLQTGGVGGVRVTGDGLAIRDLTIRANNVLGSTIAAGGLFVGGGLTGLHTVDRVTISDNIGPGLALGNANLTNVTIRRNSGDGVTYTETQGTASLTNVTIAFNIGVGVRSIDTGFGQLRLKNTLLGTNASGNCNTPANSLLTSQGSNLSSDTTCATSFTQAGDQNDVDPRLGGTDPNAGPTIALQPDSPAIDAVVSGCPSPATDQRGVSRPVGPRCDIGAYEAPLPCSLRPNVAVSTVRSGAGRLQVTISATNNFTVANNVIRTLRFGEARASINELIDVEGQTGRSGAFTVQVTTPRAQVTFTLRQRSAGSATTANFVAVDNCGDWQTLAGGGPTTFSGPDPASPLPAATATPSPSSPPTGQASSPASASNPPASPSNPPAAAPSCAPRPPVAVATARAGEGRLQVTVSTSGTNVTLQALRFGAATNATVEAGDQRGPGGSAVTLPVGTRQTTFMVARVASGAGVSVPLTVADSCGDWPTLVGAGPSAF
jgi:hypothetical protein